MDAKHTGICVGGPNAGRWHESYGNLYQVTERAPTPKVPEIIIHTYRHLTIFGVEMWVDDTVDGAAGIMHELASSYRPLTQ